MHKHCTRCEFNVVLFCRQILVTRRLLRKNVSITFFIIFLRKKEQGKLVINITYCYNLSSLWLSESKEILLSHCSSVMIYNKSKFITNQSNNWYLYWCNIDRSSVSQAKCCKLSKLPLVQFPDLLNAGTIRALCVFHSMTRKREGAPRSP